jgi:hypothetical protein
MTVLLPTAPEYRVNRAFQLVQKIRAVLCTDRRLSELGRERWQWLAISNEGRGQRRRERRQWLAISNNTVSGVVDAANGRQYHQHG